MRSPLPRMDAETLLALERPGGKSHDRLPFPIQQRGKASRVPVFMEQVLHTRFRVQPNLNYIDGALLVYFLKAVQPYTSLFLRCFGPLTR